MSVAVAKGRPDSGQVDLEAIVGAAIAMRPRLRELEAQTNRDRQVPAETIQAFKDAGFFRLLQPARFGGLDGDYSICSRVVEELTQGCSSSAWVYGVVSLHNLFLAAWPDAVQREVWGSDPDVLISSSLAPRPAERVEGGYRIDGLRSFSSGCDHADWVMVGAVAPGEAPVLCLVPIGDVAIIDDWQTLGLRGTGSKTLRFDSLFVPDDRIIPYAALNRGGRVPHAPGAEFWDLAPAMLFGSYNFSCVILGLARRAVEMTAEMLQSKVSRGVRLGDIEGHRMKLAEASALIDIARFKMHGTCRLHDAGVRAGEVYGTRDVSEVQRDNAVMVRQLRDVVISLAEINSGWVYDSDPYQQILRDMLTGSTHRSATWQAMVLPNAAHVLDAQKDVA